jgi:Na+/H+ antiporter NhaA
MGLFIGALAFSDAALEDTARVGTLAGTTLSGRKADNAQLGA